MANKIALTIIVSIILTVIMISIVNVGVSLFLDEPEYEDYCGEIRPIKIEPDREITQEVCEENQGKWVNNYCDYYDRLKVNDLHKKFAEYMISLFEKVLKLHHELEQRDSLLRIYEDNFNYSTFPGAAFKKNYIMKESGEQ